MQHTSNYSLNLSLQNLFRFIGAKMVQGSEPMLTISKPNQFRAAISISAAFIIYPVMYFDADRKRSKSDFISFEEKNRFPGKRNNSRERHYIFWRVYLLMLAHMPMSPINSHTSRIRRHGLCMHDNSTELCIEVKSRGFDIKVLIAFTLWERQLVCKLFNLLPPWWPII